MSDWLLDVRGLKTDIKSRGGVLHALDGVDFTVGAGEIVGIVGESGCGKSLTAYSILGLLPPNAAIVGGKIQFDGKQLLGPKGDAVRHLRGAALSMVFQEPLSALNPVFPIEAQIGDVLRRHLRLPRRQIRSRVVELLSHVGIASPDRVALAYPHQLSGGMRQRVLIAMAIACRPKLVIADEPTTALDTTVQAQILDLLKGLVEKDGISLILITHDLGIVSEVCKRVYVMYSGRVVEHASVDNLFRAPSHPYTSALLRCSPAYKDDDSPLATIVGSVPSLTDRPKGCAFAPRCAYAEERCRTTVPVPRALPGGVVASCHFAGQLELPGVLSLVRAGAVREAGKGT